MANIPTAADADLSQWFFKDPVKNSAGGKSLYIKESATSKRDVQVLLGKVDSSKFPYEPAENCLEALFGLYPARDNPQRRCLELAIRDPVEIEFWKKVDEKVLQIAFDNSEKWFRRPVSMEKLSEMYTRILRPPSEAFVNDDDKEVPAKTDYTIRATIIDLPVPKTDEEKKKSWERTNINYVSYDEEGNLAYREGELKEGIPRGSKVVALVRFSSITFAKNAFQLALKYKELYIWPAAIEPRKERAEMFLGVPVNKMSAEDVEKAKQQLQEQTKMDVDGDNQGDDPADPDRGDGDGDTLMF